MGAGAIAAGVAAVGAVGGSLISAQGAETAAGQEAAAYQQAAQLQEQTQQQNAARSAPFVNAGQNALSTLSAQPGISTAALNTAFGNAQSAIPTMPSQATLASMPGYQFNLSQGLAAVQAQNAAQGLGISGAASKGAASFASNLANSNYQTYFGNQQALFGDQSQQFNNQLQNQQLQFNQPYDIATMGSNAASNINNAANTAALNAGNNIGNAGVAQAAGTTGAASAYSNALNSAAGSYTNYLGISNYLNTQAALQNLGSGYNQQDYTGGSQYAGGGNIG